MIAAERVATWLVTARTPAACTRMMNTSIAPPKKRSAAGMTADRCSNSGSCAMSAAPRSSVPGICCKASGDGLAAVAGGSVGLGSGIVAEFQCRAATAIGDILQWYARQDSNLLPPA